MRSGGETAVFLIDREGNVLWDEEGNESALLALRSSAMLGDFASQPNVFVAEYEAPSRFRSRSMMAQVSPVGDSGWGIVIQQPRSIACGAARRVLQSTLVSLMILVVVAVFLAVGASQLMRDRLEAMAGRLKEAAATNHELFLGSIRTLMAAVEAKEPYIRGHSERVAAFNSSIGGPMDLDETALNRLWVSGLHTTSARS